MAPGTLHCLRNRVVSGGRARVWEHNPDTPPGERFSCRTEHAYEHEGHIHRGRDRNQVSSMSEDLWRREGFLDADPSRERTGTQPRAHGVVRRRFRQQVLGWDGAHAQGSKRLARQGGRG